MAGPSVTRALNLQLLPVTRWRIPTPVMTTVEMMTVVTTVVMMTMMTMVVMMMVMKMVVMYSVMMTAVMMVVMTVVMMVVVMTVMTTIVMYTVMTTVVMMTVAMTLKQIPSRLPRRHDGGDPCGRLSQLRRCRSMPVKKKRGIMARSGSEMETNAPLISSRFWRFFVRRFDATNSVPSIPANR